ncbi:AzlC family ABC transporter permease [Geobacter sulfurreducens]|uniref:AzlC family protein n=1 Tax=Geobacter sulfurreducens (strain ATCC 51573 / DSM 12127 / PCA) TaxID=243231 RepID=Q74F41_GEOSL|nr:AzlC family ABC transporter permease [Geobacter sulfurreducens]AAR34098.1 AzlC family protein [Geobacter sulfurreducens PCA]ADI83609.1 AzlC family protein [Geobacter sulfurreducens KN400]QVW36019.1 AzlC family ABC transporter permease [Geobacter sulfurreducens]UAC04834.1 AzlC family ABC transporter permease [Geobacter sulfurreducens]UTG93460.1 AzlC family ABC transporter permease [Geobacter sulfurreducens]
MTEERSRGVVRDGLGAAWPICLGYAPIGLALGVLAQKAGLGPLETGIMSVLVFAGGSQFIAVAMIKSGAALAAIVATTFMVNLRHALMTSALAVPLQGVRRRFLALFAYGVTDESFAVNMARFRADGWDRWRALVVNQTANLTWILSTIAGAYAGEFVPAGALGIDYALTAMFICLLIFQLRSRFYVIVAAFSGLVATALYVTIPGNSHIVIAAVTAATAGYAVRRNRAARGVV